MNLGIIAHNSKKVLIEDFCIAYKNILAKHEVYATGTTGRRIEEATSLHVHKFLAGSIGGDKQFMEMVERQDLDMVILFYNPVMIDEIPMIAVMAAFAEGTTVIRDAQELKVKESDRIAVITEGLKRMGADIQPTDDGMIIHGGKPLHGAEINSYLDHRIAMSFAVAGTICDGTLTIKDGDCVKISYPEFYEDLYSLGK